jgi:monofunctional biosynthetic peptidoglycan transglycosylase
VRRRDLALAAALACLSLRVQSSSLDLTSDAAAWRIVNDGVMGGVSSSTASRAGDALRFAGEISLANNGGFASMRRSLDAGTAVGEPAGFLVKARGDGNRYRLRVYTRDPATGREQWFGYYAVFETRAGEVTRVELRWPQFAATFRGRPVPDAPPLRFADVIGIGVMITKADHRDGRGPFSLDLLRIEPVNP